MTEIGSVNYYFGAASGSSFKALRKMEEYHVMVSAQSAATRPWDGIGSLFVDSGGYSLMLAEGEHPPADEYLDTVEDWGADIFALQDYPCEPDILSEYGRTVADHQRRTTVAAAENLVRSDERGIKAEPAVVLQGWETNDYLEHLDSLRDQGLLTDHVGIGSVCRRNAKADIREIIFTVADELPNKKLHTFGVKNEILADSDIRDALHSADTTAWYFFSGNYHNEIDDTWQQYVTQYLEYRQRLAELANELHTPDDGQTTLT
jgi:hypothetical protein